MVYKQQETTGDDTGSKTDIQGDAEAARLYDYFARDMPALPDYDTPPPTWLDNTKDVAGGIVSWLGQNKDTLAQGYEILRAITGNRLPPIAMGLDTPPAPPAEPLPPINQ